MTTLQVRRDPAPRGVSPTPSKIPVRSGRRRPLPTDKPCAPDQENQDPTELVQKLSIQPSLHDSADPRPKATDAAEKLERLVESPRLRNPLEELRSSPRGQNVGLKPSPQSEAPGAIEFVADPAALATILSGEGVKSCHLGRHSSLAQRVVIRGSQRSTMRKGQGVRASAYLAPRTPTQRLDPARASCFSRLEGSGPRSRTLRPQRLEALIPSSGPSFHPSTHPNLQELRRETGGSSRTSVHQASGLLLETPVQPASSLPGREHEITHSGEGGGGLFGLAQRVPLRETGGATHTRDSRDSHLMPTPGKAPPPSVTQPSPFGQARRVPSPSPSTQNSHSALRRLASHPSHPKTQFTPIPSAPRVQKAQQSVGLSPQPCLEEPALPWELVSIRLFDQESCVRSQKGPRRPPVVASHETPPCKNPTFQELKMQHISVLQQLLQQEAERLAAGKCSAPGGGVSSLDMSKLQPLLAEISRTLTGPEHNPDMVHLSGLSQQPELPKPCPPEKYREPQPDPRSETKRPLQPGARSEPERQPQLGSGIEPERPLQPNPATEPERQPQLGSGIEPERLLQPSPATEPERQPQLNSGIEPEKPLQPSPATEPERQPQLGSEIEPERPLQLSPRTEPEVTQAYSQEQTGLPKPSFRVESEVAEACSLEPKGCEPTLQPYCGQWAPATSSLITQRPLCASPQAHCLKSVKPSVGQAGPSSLAPRALALRQRLKACLTAIHSFHETCLDNECAFYTSRVVSASVPTRVCSNPVATLLDWQDNLCFVPIDSAAAQRSPS